MNTKEKKSVRDALRHIENFIEGFYFIDQEQYKQLIDFLHSKECELPEHENKLILNYCEEFLNPENDIFQSCDEFTEYSGKSASGEDVYTVVSGKENKFLNRLESSYYYIIENFCILERMCA